MSRLRVFDETDPAAPGFVSEDRAAMAAELRHIGVRFEQWAASQPVAPGATPELVMAAYRADIDRLVAENGFKTVDEVRFFVAGSGLFSLHVNGKVYEIRCEQGDLIGVPDGTRHWFDMGPAPSFIAIRFFTEPDGWVGHFTGTDIAKRFPRYERGQAG
jgi:1,2-dihydroxy-3-keto-5-methylthiopentene dioxygenase